MLCRMKTTREIQTQPPEPVLREEPPPWGHASGVSVSEGQVLLPAPTKNSAMRGAFSQARQQQRAGQGAVTLEEARAQQATMKSMP